MLRTLLLLAQGNVGIRRVDYIEEAREYVRKLDDEQFKKEVEEIHDIELLRFLWAVGLNAYQQKVVIERIRQLSK